MSAWRSARSPFSVLRLVLGSGLLVVGLGLVLGLAGSLALTATVPDGLLPNVRVRDPWTFVGTSLVLAAVAFVATYFPARRATESIRCWR